jgi:hypothetical protein
MNFSSVRPSEESSDGVEADLFDLSLRSVNPGWTD